MLSRRIPRALLLGILSVSAVTLSACRNVAQVKPSAASVGADAADLRATPALVLVDADSRVAFRVELALTPAEHETGLMFRKHLDPDAGMLFVFKRPAVQTFWMKNTLIPLDMLFISADREIVGIVSKATPETLTPRGVDEASLYVLEIAGGVAAERGLHPGQRVELRGVPAP